MEHASSEGDQRNNSGLFSVAYVLCHVTEAGLIEKNVKRSIELWSSMALGLTHGGNHQLLLE